MRPHIASGPRGRRLLYEFLSAKGGGRAFAAAIWDRRPAEAASELSRLIATADLTATAESVHRALADAVAFAMYWQEPDDIDAALADPAVRAQLSRIDERPILELLDFGEDALAVLWISPHTDPESRPVQQILSRWLDGMMRSVQRSAQERPDDPAAPWSGTWYSTPPRTLLSSSGTAATGTPAGLEYVEDGPPYDHAEVLKLNVSEPAVFIVNSAGDWAELCDRYPLDVTAEVRHDWYRTTGRDGPWIIPNWRDVGWDWDGVKLTVAGYLSAAGTAIPTRRAASVIAGWSPGETFWLTDAQIIERQRWTRSRDGMNWR